MYDMGAGSKLQGGAGGSAGPSTASSNSGFNSSGWNVSFGSGSISTDSTGVMKWALVAAAVGGIAWYLSRKRR